MRALPEPGLPMEGVQTFGPAFDALADTPEAAANLRARAELVRALEVLIAREGWTQADAAKRCGVTQPRMNDLLRGRISRFSLDALVNMAAACGQRVHVELEAA
jgi:predicted XRE-type DNA-binding protein